MLYSLPVKGLIMTPARTVKVEACDYNSAAVSPCDCFSQSVFLEAVLRVLVYAMHQAGCEGQKEEALAVSRREHMFFFMS